METRRRSSRPMTGFLALLTPEQRAAALAYRGPDELLPVRRGAERFTGVISVLGGPISIYAEHSSTGTLED